MVSSEGELRSFTTCSVDWCYIIELKQSFIFVHVGSPNQQKKLVTLCIFK